MTNGENILSAFSNATIRRCKNKDFTYIEVEQNDKWIADFNIDWWNAEYKEPTKNDLAVREFEGIEVTYPPEDLCIYPEYKGKPYFVIKYKENGEEIVGYGTYNPKVLSQYLKDYFISTTKNDLEVDCISREQALKELKESAEHHANDSREEVLLRRDRDIIRALPSVTPQLSSELEKNSKKLEKDFGELDCISRAQTQTEIEMNASRYTIAKERGGMGQVEWSDQLIKVSDAVDIIRHLPSVTPQEPRWISTSERLPDSEYGESDSVLVCFENETQDVLYFDGSNWCYPTGETYISVNPNNDWHNKVIAWMPLPSSYSEVKE